MGQPSACSATPTSGALTPPSSFSEWRPRRPREPDGYPETPDYPTVPVAVLHDRPAPRRFVCKHRRVATERVLCRLDMSGAPSDALVLADIEFADGEFAGVSGAPVDPSAHAVSSPPVASPPVAPPPVSPQQTP